MDLTEYEPKMKKPKNIFQLVIFVMIHAFYMLMRPFRAVLRLKLFPNLFAFEQELFIDRAVDPGKAAAEAGDFITKMKTLYPEFWNTALTQMAQWFHENQPPNYLGFTVLDPATGNFLEVMVRKVTGLTEHDVNQRMKLGLETIAAMPPSPLADVERLRDVAVRTLAACNARKDFVAIPVEENRLNAAYGELYAFNVLYNIWLEADQKRRNRAEIAQKLAAEDLKGKPDATL